MKILKNYGIYYNSQRAWEKEVNTMVNDVQILKGHLKNSCKGFFFMQVGKGEERGNYFSGWHRHTNIFDDKNYVMNDLKPLTLDNSREYSYHKYVGIF